MAKSSKPKGEKKPKAGRKLTPAEQMTADQREAYKAHSPIFAAVLEWARMFEEVG